MSDQDRISPYNINTISIRQVVRIFVLDIFSIGQTKKFTTICIPTDWNFPIFENSTLFSRTKRKERKDVLKLWEISWPQNISLEILQRTACVSLSCVSLSTVFLVISEPCVYFWVCLNEDDIQMRDWCIACWRPMFHRYHLSGKTFGATSRSKERSGDDRTYP